MQKKLELNLRKYLDKDTIVMIVSHRDSDFVDCDRVLEIRNNHLVKNEVLGIYKKDQVRKTIIPIS